MAVTASGVGLPVNILCLLFVMTGPQMWIHMCTAVSQTGVHCPLNMAFLVSSSGFPVSCFASDQMCSSIRAWDMDNVWHVEIMLA